ncbi:peptidoglycan DD-metalloendopeptidase family protein [Phycicoccus sonneratiae]|uniref:Peptidoglycan DD-metalloendopeptidase family protein n=1 Tax=Phycicoccus sonneratiae TaxID=2807628 RepID=A0ABS2CS14_9MICO|nr:peptidoglycan DD-metalloendopeptidase family protein [Phycicoccus sonneraticus]MBM6402615.1 peptidoglycan DD-metalloendopeptidase family protein [Phycicoccus sonneraticus]
MSSKAWWAFAVVAALLLGAPFGAALLLTAVLTPAVAAQPDPTCVGPAATVGPWRPPFAQPYTRTSPFGMRFHPIYHRWRLHSGTDLVSLPAPGPVVAAHDGTVTAAGPRGSYGNAVDIDHGGRTVTRYAHLARINPIARVGATVRAGQVIGVEGSTGASTGNHLHFEIRLHDRPADPVPFMAAHGAPLDGRAVPASRPTQTPTAVAIPETGLPPAGSPRRNSMASPPAPILARIKALYRAAGDRYHLPWELLAGIGMEETRHGATHATSPAGAQGLMQFMPGTFAVYGVDGDHDGTVSITSDADSVHSAANYLTHSGALTGPAGVRRALFAYNHADWYVNDVLHYAHAYAGDPTTSCPN